MAATVSANGLTITHKASGGTHFCSVPDVCKTPTPGGPVPIPYPIFSTNTLLAKGTTTVLADGGNMIAHKKSIFTKCTGDEPGTIGGVKSGTFIQKSEWITYSPNVYVQGKNICRLTDKLFMNNKNTVAASGQIERPTILNDPVMAALCKIFCREREKWQKCRGTKPCPRPSTTAKHATQDALDNPKSPLSKAMARKYPGAFGAAEKSLYTAADALGETARKVYTKTGLENALKRAARKASRNAALRTAGRLTKRAWFKLVPGLNILGTALDIYEGAVLLKDIYGAISNASNLMDNAVRVVPDYSVIGPDGSVQEIYDFKFDAPKTDTMQAYQDTFSNEQSQLYEQLTGDEPVALDKNTCECDAGKSLPTG